MASLDTSLRNLSTHARFGAKRPCTWCIFWGCVPPTCTNGVVETCSSKPRALWPYHFWQILLLYSAPADSLQPQRVHDINRANNTTLHQQCKALLSRVSTMTFRLRNFISIMYPAQHKECVAFGASTNFNDHAMSTTTGVGCTCRLICCRTFADAVRR
jgi:hypothetical protein